MKENIDLPDGWRVERLGNIVQVLDNLRKPINRTERREKNTGKDASQLYPYYGATGQVGLIDSYITDGEYILVGEDGAPFLDLYKSKAYKIKGKTWVNNHAHILKGIEGVSLNEFILHYLNSIDYHPHVNGTTRLKLTKSSLVQISFPLPPTNVQHQIVDKIEELFSELDKGIENLKTAQQQLKVYRQAVLKWAFEGKLTNDVSKEGELPVNWEWKNLLKLGEVGRGKSKHRPRNDKKLFGGDYPFIQTGEVKAAGYIIKDFEQTYSDFGLAQSKLWPKGTLCITIAANIAEVAFLGFDGCFPDSIVGFTPNNEIVHGKYIYYFFKGNQSRLEAFAPATAQKNINLNTLENLIIPYCKPIQQKKVIQEIESRLSVCDNMEETINGSLLQAEALRQSILKKAFEGKLINSNTCPQSR